MLLFDRDNWPRHRPWLAFVAMATLGATLWYAVASLMASRLLGGGSLPGFTFGVIGGVICLFEFLIWPRKKFRAWRIGRVQTWMKLHIWLGLLSLPILVLHSGFRLGGSISAALMILFLVVIASGVWGLALQNILPRKMLVEVPAETIHSQIDRILGHHHDEAARLVQETCGKAVAGSSARTPSASSPEAPDDDEDEDAEETRHFVVGAVRSAGKISGKVLQSRSAGPSVEGSEALRVFYDLTAGPFLTPDGLKGSPLRQAERARVIFEDLRTKLDVRAHPAADALENLCDQRRQLAEQQKLHFWLHSWLVVHLPLSVALIVLMFVHIYVALKYL